MKNPFMKGIALGVAVTMMTAERNPSVKSLLKKGKKVIKNKLDDLM